MNAKEEIEQLYAAANANGGRFAEEHRLRLTALLPIERQEEEEARHNAALDACPFKVGDRVMHKSGNHGSIRWNGADVGVVKAVYTTAKTTRTAHIRVAKLSVDWPAPCRIGGDGWRRSNVLASAVIPATEEEVERWRALNRARHERLEAQRDQDRLALEAARRAG